MVDRVALLSDVHGVLPALEAVLAEPDVRAADLVVLTGDLAAGPLPVPTLDLLASLGERAVWVAAEFVLVDSSMARRRAALSTVDDTVTTVVCGHTHMPFVRLVDRRLVVNPGSVGMPYGSVGAHWALLGPGTTVALRRTAYDIEAACARIAAESGYPDAARWADDYLHARGSDAEALEAFHARAANPG